MGLISWIIIGLLVGFVARYFFPGRPGGLVPTLVLAAVGALIGGYISTYIHGGTLATLDPRTMLTALVGALLMTGIVKILRI
ncbi:GlsB/YeaQ/YmgE family stress response membrane protein [Erwinia sp. AnSW2-5]|uniref:GlsB/YeaQ/YmgE family stress response membrane protein n=1 Tax=Erwinia sp. AnSW2-5 TaxID=3367692 RepID=UPI00385D387F